MKTKSSSRPAKKKSARPSTASVRGRAAKTSSARAKVKKAAPKAASKAKPASKAAAPKAAKYQQSGAPWWKAFL